MAGERWFHMLCRPSQTHPPRAPALGGVACGGLPFGGMVHRQSALTSYGKCLNSINTPTLPNSDMVSMCHPPLCPMALSRVWSKYLAMESPMKRMCLLGMVALTSSGGWYIRPHCVARESNRHCLPKLGSQVASPRRGGQLLLLPGTHCPRFRSLSEHGNMWGGVTLRAIGEMFQDNRHERWI